MWRWEAARDKQNVKKIYLLTDSDLWKSGKVETSARCSAPNDLGPLFSAGHKSSAALGEYHEQKNETIPGNQWIPFIWGLAFILLHFRKLDCRCHSVSILSRWPKIVLFTNRSNDALKAQPEVRIKNKILRYKIIRQNSWASFRAYATRRFVRSNLHKTVQRSAATVPIFFVCQIFNQVD